MRRAASPVLALLMLAWTLVSAALPSAAQAAPCTREQQALLARAQAAYQGLSSFEGQFEQEDRQPDGQVQKAAGQIAYRRPGQMRWAYAPPNPQLLVTDGKTVWLYDPLLDTVTEQPLQQVTEGTPLRFLLGAGSLTEDFTCRAATLAAPSDGLAYLELVARTAVPTLDFIQLGVQPATARLVAFRMVDTQHSERWVRLSQLKFGVSFAQGFFTFQVKPGMDVISK